MNNLIRLIKKYNPKTRRSKVDIRRSSDGKILMIISGPSARYMSNALYHLFRALGKRNVRRWLCGSEWCVSFS